MKLISDLSITLDNPPIHRATRDPARVVLVLTSLNGVHLLMASRQRCRQLDVWMPGHAATTAGAPLVHFGSLKVASDAMAAG